MIDIKLTISEVEGLLKFLTENINSDTISSFDGPLSQHLILAFLKLQKAKDTWYESMQPSD